MRACLYVVAFNMNTFLRVWRQPADLRLAELDIGPAKLNFGCSLFEKVLINDAENIVDGYLRVKQG